MVSTVRPGLSLPPALLQPAEVPHHALSMGWSSWGGCTLRGMSITEAVATHNQLVEGVIVFLTDLPP